MAKHYLTALFSPASIVVLTGAKAAQPAWDGAAGHGAQRPGAEPDDDGLQEPHNFDRDFGAQLRAGGFTGPLAVLDPGQRLAAGALAGFPDERADLAVIAVPAAQVAAALAYAGRLSCRAALVIGAGLDLAGAEALHALARRHGMQLLGPNSLGFQRPLLKLNASAAGPMAAAGTLALISQSGALSAAVLDWAAQNNVGFSTVVSLGQHSAVDLAQTLDFLADDTSTHAIVIYMEGIGPARRFMSALRAAAKSKPVVVLKAGRHGAGPQMALTHSGSIVGSDEVFEAALRRAGAVRVDTFVELFTAAKALAARSRPVGARLAVVANGGGPGVLAADRLATLGRQLAQLAPATLAALAPQLAPGATLAGLLDLSGAASAAQYRSAVEACDGDPGVDAVLVIYTPTLGGDPQAVAEALVPLHGRLNKPLLTCWMGDLRVSAARRTLNGAGIATFRTPEAAVDAFHNIAAFYQNQQMLRQVPAPMSPLAPPDLEGARLLIDGVLAARRAVLTEMESKALLAAFHIPVTQTMLARDANEAMLIASQFGYPVALKVDSSDIPHKSDVYGVALDVRNAVGVRDAHHDMLATVARLLPQAAVNGVTVQKMAGKRHGRELYIGVVTDRQFGPVIGFGAGGVMIEVIADRAVELPPLNQFLARRLVGRVRSAAMLGAWRGAPAANMAAVEQILLRVSEMVCALPQLREMDINPLIVDADGALVVDARIVIGPAALAARSYDHLAILPYPDNYTQDVPLRGGALCALRAIQPADASMLQDFMRGLSDQARYYRFVSTAREHSEKMLAQFTLIDYDREMALVALERRRVAGEGGAFVESESIIGVARYVANPDRSSCEFALVVGDAYMGQGLGSRLMLSIMDVARDRGLNEMEGLVLARNQPMLRLVQRLGFSVGPYPDDPDFKLCSKTL